MKPTDAELDNRFRYHRPDAEAISLHAEVTEATLALAKKLRDVCPDGHHLHLVLDYLAMVRMLANAAIACDRPGSETRVG